MITNKNLELPLNGLMDIKEMMRIMNLQWESEIINHTIERKHCSSYQLILTPRKNISNRLSDDYIIYLSDLVKYTKIFSI
jgi:hypothetical protein